MNALRRFRRELAFLLLLFVLPSLCACGAGEQPPAAEETAAPQRVEPKGKVYYTYFDTVSYVYDYAGDSAERFDTVNKNAGGEPLTVDRRLVDFLLCAKDMYELTDGEMNVMLGSVLRLWHKCREAAGEDPQNAAIPEEEELRRAWAHTDISLLEIDEEACTVRIADPEASIDVGALGKGYATERAAEYLEREGAVGYVLNIGGNIRCIGDRPDGSGWVTAIRDPDKSAQDFACRIRIRDTACVTSGVYERYFTVNGTRYHHIIDKDTLYPAAYFGSLTVITRDSALADALSTALFCMPMEEGMKLAESIGGVELLWIFPDGSSQSTPGFFPDGSSQSTPGFADLIEEPEES